MYVEHPICRKSGCILDLPPEASEKNTLDDKRMTYALGSDLIIQTRAVEEEKELHQGQEIRQNH